MSHHSAGSPAPSTMTGECKIEMLWNWNVMDACFLSSSWHIKNNAMFAASCIGVVLLVVCLEFLRRLGKEHDAYLHRQFQRHLRLTQSQLEKSPSNECCTAEPAALPGYATYRASPLQQLCRAVIHGATLGVAYIVMLLAMHYNGYVIISIVIGATLGKFLCDWMVVRIPYSSGLVEREGLQGKSEVDVAGPTGCCA
ncbi:ctr copper transporter family protein-like protein [Westerdykella ornata]|uniref:Copper transport protein n=1 Tax=Westerdykella ornata TaxID=318751 RepID=A0A6A6JFS6_WESOR|nr:ctr copper transporter family protein-like protein [Westerdykella ornata]KAF2275401.1 ctr copper transporter family protein-like protein [Westerdykella ornata]